MSESSSISLLELQNNIQNVITQNLEIYYWVVAEISEISVNYKGHCYLSLVEKDKKGDNIKAKARAIIWATRFNMIKAYFESTSGETLKAGIKVLVKVSVNYHELYGLSFQIFDIDPKYTLGDIESRRNEVVEKLQQTGIIDMNKTLDFPLVIRNIAIISSDTAAGFGDFIAQIESNHSHYHYNMSLFKAAMQGVDTEKTVIKALEDIYNSTQEYDVVVIIRGGGSKSDLSAFDNFEIASNIAQFPIPVLSGIGHERDASVVDIVAHKHLKTPTAVAEFIIQHTSDFENRLDNELQQLLLFTNKYMEKERIKITNLNARFIPSVRQNIESQSLILNSLTHKIHRNIRHSLTESAKQINNSEHSLTNSLSKYFSKQNLLLNFSTEKLKTKICNTLISENHKIEKLEQQTLSNDPKRLLNKGYTLTTYNNNRIDSVLELKKGQHIKTWFKDGNVESEIL